MKTRVVLASFTALLATGLAAPAAHAEETPVPGSSYSLNDHLDYCVYDRETGKNVVCVPSGPSYVERYVSHFRFHHYHDTSL